MTLQQLRIVLETVRREFSLTHAARALGTSQPALSRAILELEAELGTDLFVRHGKRIRDRIFYPLVSGREGGSGLGLTLAQTFVQQHHGLIECDSQPGRTDFKILIPLP